jgi:hypothetical protein
MAKSTTSAASAREMYFASRKSSSVPVIRINPAAFSAAWMLDEFILFHIIYALLCTRFFFVCFEVTKNNNMVL